MGHLGDGNLHPNICINDDDPGAVERAHKVIDEIFEAALACEGTLTGEHGIGLGKKPYLSWQFSNDEINFMRELKRTFDPEGLLNPGKIFDLATEEGRKNA